MKGYTIVSVLAGFLATGVHSESPGIFGGMQSDVNSASESATATSTSHTAQNASSLTYPKCEKSGRDWCGIVVGGYGANSTYDVSITDSKCKQVVLKNNIAAGATESFSSPVGDWTFGVVGSSGLNMTYNGRNISDYQQDWDSWAIEEYDPTENSLVIYGGLANCTSADHETSGASGATVGAGAALAAVAIGMLGFF